MILKKIEKHYGIKLTKSNYEEKFIEILKIESSRYETINYLSYYIKKHEHKIDITWAIYMIDVLMNQKTGNKEVLVNNYKILSLYPLNYYLEEGMGSYYMEIGDNNKAKIHYENAIKLKEDDPHVYYNLGIIYNYSGKHKQAKEYFEKSLEYVEDNGEHNELIARSLYNLGVQKSIINDDNSLIQEYAKKALEYKDDYDFALKALNVYEDNTEELFQNFIKNNNFNEMFNNMKNIEELRDKPFEELVENDKFQNIVENVFKQFGKNIRGNLNNFTLAISKKDTYEDYLNTLTKKELNSIRKSYGFKGLSQLNKKDLIQALAERIPKNLDKKIKLLGHHEIDLLINMLDNDGAIEIGYDYKIGGYLESIGIAFSTRVDPEFLLLVLPKEISSPLRKLLKSPDLEDQIRRNTEVCQILDGTLHYYGVIDGLSLIDLLKDRYNIDMDTRHLIGLIYEYPKFSPYIEINEGLIYFILNEEYKAIYASQQSRKDLDYYPLKYITIREIERAGELLLNKSQKEVINYFRKVYGLRKDEARDIIDDLIYTFQYCEVSDLVDICNEMFSLDDFSYEEEREILQNLTKLYNNTRRWELKGHKPADFMTNNNKATRQRIVKKVGRNEPCPCGSGKKYKKCCGKNKM